MCVCVGVGGVVLCRCVCVSVSGVLFSVGVCVCDLLIFLHGGEVDPPVNARTPTSPITTAYPRQRESASSATR